MSQKAYAAHASEQYALALERYTQIIRLQPHNAWAYLNRSGVYTALGDVEKAVADWNQAHKIDPLISAAK